MVFTCKKTDDIYKLSIKYYIVDYYDWEEGSTTKGGLVVDGEMYMLHKAGKAKSFKSIGIYE